MEQLDGVGIVHIANEQWGIDTEGMAIFTLKLVSLELTN